MQHTYTGIPPDYFNPPIPKDCKWVKVTNGDAKFAHPNTPPLWRVVVRWIVPALALWAMMLLLLAAMGTI